MPRIQLSGPGAFRAALDAGVVLTLAVSLSCSSHRLDELGEGDSMPSDAAPGGESEPKDGAATSAVQANETPESIDSEQDVVPDDDSSGAASTNADVDPVADVMAGEDGNPSEGAQAAAEDVAAEPDALPMDDDTQASDPTRVAAPEIVVEEPDLTLSSSSPANRAVDVATSAHLELQFSSVVQLGAGAISLRRTADDSLFEQVSVDDRRVTLETDTLVVDFDGWLAGNTEYYVVVEAGVVVGVDGEAFAGISASDAFGFTSAAVSYPGGLDTPPILWLDASNTVSLKTSSSSDSGSLESGSLEVWGDLSGQGYSALADSSETSPRLISDALGGLPVLRFDGVDDLMVTGDLIDPPTFDVFVVWQSSDAISTSDIQHILSNDRNFQINRGHVNAAYRTASAVNVGSAWYSADFGEPELGVPFLWNTSFDAAKPVLETFSNGSSAGSNALMNAAPNDNPLGLAIGGAPWGERYFKGDVAEVIVFDRLLTAAERDSVESYVADKWRVEVSP